MSMPHELTLKEDVNMKVRLSAGLLVLALGACAHHPHHMQTTRNVSNATVPAGVSCSWFAQDSRTTIAGCSDFVLTPVTAQDAQTLSDLNTAFSRAVSPVVNFDFGSSALRPDSRAILAQQAQWIRQKPHIHFSIYGHTDAVGSAQSNFRLAEERAQTVLEFLVSQGVNRDQVAALVSYGELRPVIVTTQAEELNRRVVVEVAGFVRDARSRSQEPVLCTALLPQYRASFSQCVPQEETQPVPRPTPPRPFSVSPEGTRADGRTFGASREVSSDGTDTREAVSVGGLRATSSTSPSGVITRSAGGITSTYDPATGETQTTFED